MLDPEAATAWANQHGLAGTPLADLAANPDVLAAVDAGVAEVNQQFANVEQIKKFVLVGEEWLPTATC